MSVLLNFSNSSIWENECWFYLHTPNTSFLSFSPEPPPPPPPLLSSLPSFTVPLCECIGEIVMQGRAGGRGGMLCKAAQNSCCVTLTIYAIIPQFHRAILQIPSLYTVCKTFRYRNFSLTSSFSSCTLLPLCLPPLINLFFLPFNSLQPPVEAIYSLHLIFLLPTLSSSAYFLQFCPLPNFLFNPPFLFLYLLSREDLGKCLMDGNKWAKEWAIVRCCTFMQMPQFSCFLLSQQS